MAATHEDRNANLSPGVAIKAPCRVATTAAITLSGEQTIDGVACVAGNRVLVKSQTNAVDNGIWGVSSGAWSREPDFDGNRDVVKGTFVFITDGTVNAGAFYECTTTGTVVFGTSNITFAVGALGPIVLPLNLSNTTFTQAGTGATARSGLDKTRDIVSVKDFNAVGDGVTDDTAAIQAAFDSVVAASTYCGVFFPRGIYKCGRLDLSAANYQNAKQISVFGIPKGSRILSTCSGTTALFDIGTLAGYGDSDKWTFQDLGLKANSAGNGKAILFQALGWHPKFINLDIDGFQNGLELRSCITAQIIGCRIRNCTVAGIDIYKSATGNPTIDQDPTTARIIDCGISGNAKGINRAGIQAVIDDCVFEGNTTFGLNAAGLGEGSVVSNTWHEGTTDSIDGEGLYVSFINCHGIMASNTDPLFTNSGSMFSQSASDDTLALHCGQFNNKVFDRIWRLQSQNVRSLRQFDGITYTNSSPGAAESHILTDSASLNFTGGYTTGEIWQVVLAVRTIETDATLATGRREYTFFAMGNIDGANINVTYILPTASLMTVAGIGVKATTSGTEFAIYRDAGTGAIGVQWAAKNANTTAIAFRVRPLADMSA